MKWMKTSAVMLALGSLLCTTVAFAAPNMADNLYRGSKLIGADVENAQGENLGNIKDVVLNSRGHIEYAVLAFGGFMGMGEKYFAVPWATTMYSIWTKSGSKMLLALIRATGRIWQTAAGVRRYTLSMVSHPGTSGRCYCPGQPPVQQGCHLPPW